jgi:hypothetical protein
MDEAVRIAFEAGLPYAGLRGLHPHEDLWRAVAHEWARRERVVPLAVEGGRLTLAATRPELDLDGIGVAYAGIDVVIASAQDIDAALAWLPDAPPAARPPAADRRAPVTDPASPERLGDLLVAHGVTTDAEVAAALEEQQRTGGLLGDILLAGDAVDEERLRAVLAEQLGLPVVDLGGYEPDADALELVPEGLQRRLRCVPLAVDQAAVYVAVADPLDTTQLAALREGSGGLEPRCFLAAGDAVDDLLQELHAERWAAGIRAGVAARFPQESCGTPAGPALLATLAAALVAAIAGLAVAPATTALVLVALAATATAAPALLALPVALAGLRRRAVEPPATGDEDAGPGTGRRAGLPLTTLLLPLSGGPGASVSAAATLAALDHPRARLEVLLLCPAPDLPGVRAARELTRRRPHRLVVIPADVPATRAGMLAYGLLLARGDRVAILDPGDVPAPGLLRAAGDALHRGGRRTAAAQAAPAPPPGGHGLVGAWTAAQCAAWHGLLAPGLARLGLPMPLASTGVVMRRDALEEVAGWDPACSAEGVDLGLRLHKAGFRATTVDASVSVGAAAAPAVWLRAQARWWRGALGVWLVQLRHPYRTLRRLGPIGTAALALTGLAAVIAPLAWLPILGLAVLGALQALDVTGALLPEAVVRLAGAEVLAVSAALVLLGGAGALRRGGGAAARAALLAPAGFTIAGVGAWLGAAGIVAALGRGSAGDAP